MEEKGKGWLIWLLIVPAAVAAGALATKWVMHGAKGAPALPPPAAEAPARPAPAAPPPAPAEPYELQGDEPEAQEASVSWGKQAATAGAPAGGEAPAPEASPADAKKSFGMGAAYGALTKAADALIGNPKALAALFNNDYVVKGFMSRDTVKRATANSASLAAYLKNPANLSKFMAKAPVQRGLNDRAAVNAVASSKLVGAMLDTPGGQALLKDPTAVAEIVKANPELASVLANPNLMAALAGNPRTSGIVTQMMVSGRGR